MLNSKTLYNVQLVLFLFGIAYLLVDIPYAVEIILISTMILSLDLFVRGILFRIRRNRFVEMGQVERFHYEWVAFIIIILVGYFGGRFGSEIEALDIFPKREQPANGYLITIIGLPYSVWFILGVVFKEMPTYAYLSDHGVMTSMNIKESFKWSDFSSYRMLPDLTMIRFRIKSNSEKPKFFFVSYDKDHFNEHEEEILGILDENLKSEDQ